jgi:uncharacterized protein YbjT (DUF2867 family)
VVGLIRNPDHADDVRAAGASPVVCDLEHSSVSEVAGALGGSDAAVFAAGAGPGSGADRKLTMDRDGAVKLVDAATSASARRFVIVSSVGAESAPSEPSDVFGTYLRAKAEADAAVQSSELDWTIVRPGRLTDDPGAGRVRIQADPFRGAIPRDDVAAVLAAVLDEPRSVGRVLYVNGGDDEVGVALEACLTPET